jgi:hypothetical protein
MDDDNHDDDDNEEEGRIIPNIKQRERAFSECIKIRKQHKKRLQSISSMTLNRPQSDSDLSHIDREKTFAYDAKRATVEPAELLVKVACALGGFRMDENMAAPSVTSSSNHHLGIHGFSDSQILASEQHYSDWSLGPSEKSFITPTATTDGNIAAYGRNRRALSEVRIPIEDSVKVTNLMLHLFTQVSTRYFSISNYFQFLFPTIKRTHKCIGFE